MTRKMPTPEEIVVEVAEDGTILEPPIAELYAIAIVDGDPPDKAWKTAGGATSERQMILKGVLDTHAGFKARVDALAAERHEVAKDKIFGQAVWMIAQGFREARAKHDRPQMLEYAKLRLQAAQGVSRLHEKTLPPPEKADEAPRARNPVGKPAEKSPQSTRNMDDLRAALLQKGMRQAPGEDEEAA